jgi:polyhydroxybutyrate depolymerase
MKTKVIYTLLVILILIAGCAHYLLQWNPFKPLYSTTIQINNMERKFYYYVPSGVSANPKLIFVLHGSKMTAMEMIIATGHQFNKLADESKNVIIVYPEGYKKSWNTCKMDSTREAKKLNLDDVGFIEHMINFFSTHYNINSKEVFAMGVSNGAQMCYKLAKQKPGLFKGFAAVSANLPIETNNDCFETNQPVSILVMNGTADPIEPYNGGEIHLDDGASHGSVVSTWQTMRYWKNLAKCDTASAKEYDFPDIDKSDNSISVKYTYINAATNKEVVLVKIINGGHNIPNPTFFLWPKVLGNVNKDINAPKIIFDYFMSLK